MMKIGRNCWLFLLMMSMFLLSSCSSLEYKEPIFDVKSAADGEESSRLVRVNRCTLLDSIVKLEQLTPYSFVVSPTVFTDTSLDRINYKTSFSFNTNVSAINALQYAYNLKAKVIDSTVFLDVGDSEIIENPALIELLFLEVKSSKSFDLGAELSFLPANMLTSRVNEIIYLTAKGDASAARGWTLSRRLVSLDKTKDCLISNSIVKYVERSNISDYGTRTVNGYDERESGDILELNLLQNYSNSSVIGISLEQSEFENEDRKAAIKAKSVQVVTENDWRIIADYFAVSRVDSVKFFHFAKTNDKMHFLVLARKSKNSAFDLLTTQTDYK